MLCQMFLHEMGEGHSMGAFATGGALFQQKFASLGDDADFGAHARAALETGHGLNGTQIVVAEDDREFLGLESLSDSILQALTL